MITLAPTRKASLAIQYYAPTGRMARDHVQAAPAIGDESRRESSANVDAAR